jgi:hypothetical protein
VFASGVARADLFFWHSKKKQPAAVKSAGPPQDRKLEERIVRPDMGMEYNLENSSFGGADRKAQSKAASVKNFDGLKPFESKAFSSKAYAGTKTSSLKDEKYAVNSAELKGKYEIPNATKKQDTKTVPVNASRDSNKTVAVDASREANQKFFGKGRSQDRMDAVKGPPEEKALARGGYGGDLKQLTIDDIRELLNKSK